MSEHSLSVCRFDEKDGMSLIVDGRGVPVARWWGGNVLREDPPLPRASDPAPLMMWSGWTGAAPFERHPGAWGPGAMADLRARIKAIRSVTAAPVYLRTHARHVLSDAQRCGAFVSEFGGLGFGLVLDPVGMLEPSMLPEARDHLARVFERLGGVSAWVVVSGARVGSVDGEEAVIAVAGDGVVGRDEVRSLAQREAPGARLILVQSASGPSEARTSSGAG